MDSVKVEAVDFSAKIGTSCQICLYSLCWNSDSLIQIVVPYDRLACEKIDIKDGYPRICEECKKRLKKMLYESQKEE